MDNVQDINLKIACVKLGAAIPEKYNDRVSATKNLPELFDFIAEIIGDLAKDNKVLRRNLVEATTLKGSY